MSRTRFKEGEYVNVGGTVAKVFKDSIVVRIEGSYVLLPKNSVWNPDKPMRQRNSGESGKD